jgi:hypothetical protein
LAQVPVILAQRRKYLAHRPPSFAGRVGSPGEILSGCGGRANRQSALVAARRRQGRAGIGDLFTRHAYLPRARTRFLNCSNDFHFN